METSIMNGMCRCCASEGAFKDVKTTYTWMGEEEVYSDMLQECFNICLSTSETGEDGGICEVCITQLRNALNFKKQVQSSEEQFKKHVMNKLFKPNIVKVEMTGDEENDSDDNNMSAEEGYSGTEYEVPIKTETDEPKPKKRGATTKATTSRAKKAKVDSGETSTKRPPVIMKKKTEDIQETSQTSTKTNKIKNKDNIIKNKNNLKQVLLHSNATPIKRYGDLGYMCCYCDQQYILAAELKKHTLETHFNIQKAYFMKTKRGYDHSIKIDITSLQCRICNQNIDTIELLLAHLKNKHKKTIFTDCKNQIIPYKFATEQLQCCICLNVFSKFRMLIEHMNTHYRNYVCEICDTGFARFSSLKTHKLCHATGTFECQNCDETFDTKEKRRKHEQAKHRNMQFLVKCGYCDETFYDYRKKDNHLIAVHGRQTHKCQYCDKSYKDTKALNIHVKKNYLMEKSHKCTECDKGFFNKTGLRNHMVKHTGLRAYKCVVCLKSYGRKKTLAEHMKIHNDDRRFKCEHCGQAFVQKCSWRGHMKSKHGEIV